MNKYKIAIVIGSLRKDSFNRKLANAFVKLAPPEFSFKEVQINDLPLYNQDDDANQAKSVRRMKNEINDAQGIFSLRPNTTVRYLVCSRTQSTTLRVLMVKTFGWISLQVFWGVRSASSARPWHNSICATFWRFQTYRHSANQKHSSMQRMDCLTRPVMSVQTASNLSRTGWTATSHG